VGIGGVYKYSSTDSTNIGDFTWQYHAAGSQQGREFATRNANFLFTTVLSLDKTRGEISALQQQAQANGRSQRHDLVHCFLPADAQGS